METDPTRMCELLVGLPEVRVLAVEDRCGEPIRVHVEQAGERPGCLGCGGAAKVKDRDVVELVDLPAFGRPARLMWHKVRWCCPDPDCEMCSWTWADPRIAGSRVAMTDRAGRWATEQVGRYARGINEIAKELGCDWHTVNDAVIAYGTALVDDPGRIGAVEALGLDETLFARLGRFHRQHWSTSIVDVAAGQLLDVVPGRAGKATADWLEAQGPTWRGGVRWATLDLSGPYKAVLDLMLPDATQIADPFHLVKLANSKLDETRRRVQSRPSDTGNPSPIRSTVVGGFSPKPTSASTSMAGPSCSACSTPATPPGRSAPPGTRRKSSGRYMTTTIPTWPRSSSGVSDTISKTPPARPRFAALAGHFCAGRTRSPPGTEPMSPKVPPRGSTTSSRESSERRSG